MGDPPQGTVSLGFIPTLTALPSHVKGQTFWFSSVLYADDGTSFNQFFPATTSGNLAPSTDNSSTIGTASLRYASMSSVAFNVFGASGDANATASLQSGALKFGAGGGSVLDVTLGRSSSSAFSSNAGFVFTGAWTVVGSTTGIGADASAGNLILNTSSGKQIIFQVNGILEWTIFAGGDLRPNTDASLSIGSASLRLLQANCNQFNVYHASGDANPSAQLGDGALKFGGGGAGTLDTVISRQNAALFLFGNNSSNDNTATFGTRSNRLSGIFNSSVGYHIINTTGDANDIAFLGTSLQFGAGGGSALDVTLGRSSSSAFSSNSGFVFTGAWTVVGSTTGIGADASAGNLLLNAPTGQSIFGQINGVTVLTVAGALITLAQPLSGGAQNIYNANSLSLSSTSTDILAGALVGSRAVNLAIIANSQTPATTYQILLQTQSAAGGISNTITRMTINAGSAQGSAGIQVFETLYFGANASGFAYASQAAILADASAGNLILNAPTGKSILQGINATTVLTVAAASITAAQLLILSSASIGYNTTTLTGTTTLTSASPTIVLCDATSGAFTVTLPSAASQKGIYFIIIKKDSGANAVTVSRAGADTIQGATTKSLASQYNKAILVSDGSTTWYDVGIGGI